MHLGKSCRKALSIDCRGGVAECPWSPPAFRALMSQTQRSTGVELQGAVCKKGQGAKVVEGCLVKVYSTISTKAPVVGWSHPDLDP